MLFDRFMVWCVVFLGIVGGVDFRFDIGDVVVLDCWV